MKAIASIGHRGWTLRFPDGATIKGRSATQVLARWQSVQWHGTTAAEWREELAKRAYIWSQALVDPTLPANQLLEDLELAGLIKIERN